MIPYVEDRRNILVVRLAAPVREDVATTLRYALERGIEAAFQLEDSELSSEALPDPDFRARMLFTESAEGGAGVLRRLQDEPGALAVAARAALRIAHFDPDTGKDLDRAEGASERCERGCYDCLLSYGNQLEHALVDRHAARDLLLTLAATRAAAAGSGISRDDQLSQLRVLCTSTLELRFVDWLAARELRLPDDAQVLVSPAYARPDFVYHRPDGEVAVFVDGPDHDCRNVAERDAAAEERLMDLGWSVLRVRYDDDWDDVARRRVSVFGEGRGGVG